MATILGVSDNELIRTTWGNSVADELNLRTVKNNTSQTMAANLTVNGLITSGTQVTITSAAPTSITHATRKDYVDGQIAGRVAIAGSTMTGALQLPAAGTAGMTNASAAVRRDYVNSTFVDIGGSTMTGDLVLGGHPTTTAGVELSADGQIQGAYGTDSGPSVYLRRAGSAGVAGHHYERYVISASTIIGSVSIDPGTAGVSYNKTSDYRLKDDLGPIPDASSAVLALQPKVIRWKANDYVTTGFIAHEVAEVVPAAVTGAKDAVFPPDDPFNPGGINPQQLDTGALIPTLTAALQEALTTIADLTARVAALEGTPA